MDEIAARVHQRQAQAVVLRGEAGVGKSALLNYLHSRTEGGRVLRATGVASEMNLDYASLHQLLGPLLAQIDLLPAPQREVMRAVFGRRLADRFDPDLVGRAALGLLARAAADRPLLCLVDDGHRLDRRSADVLSCVGRLAGPESIALVVATRNTGGDDFKGFPCLQVSPLADREAHVLLRTVLPGPLDSRVVRRLLAEAAGNPRSILETSSTIVNDEVAVGFGVSWTRGSSRGSGAEYLRRIERLCGSTRRLLVTLAAGLGDDTETIWSAAEHLGVGSDDIEAAIAAGLVTRAGQELRFSHPLVRSTVYRAASVEERRRVHGALADAMNSEHEPEGRAWHLAGATAGLDEDVAQELDCTADRALARGGFAAATAFRERAAALTPDPALRTERALRAAQSLLRAGAAQRAVELLPGVDAGTDERVAAEVYQVRARAAFELGSRKEESMLIAANRLVHLNSTLALETYRDALSAAFVGGRLARRDRIIDVARAVEAISDGAESDAAPHGLLTGLSAMVGDRHGAGVPLLRDSLTAFAGSGLSTEADVQWLPLATRAAVDVWDDSCWHALSARTIEVARTNGQLQMLSAGLLSRATLELFSGGSAAAEAAVREAETVGAATIRSSLPYGDLMLAAWAGDERRFSEVSAAIPAAELVDRSEGRWLTVQAWTTAMLNNGLGRYPEALLGAEEGSAHFEELGAATWSLVELVEAAVRAGVRGRAIVASARLTEVADACGTDWALGIAACSRALMSSDAQAETAYREAIERLAHTTMRFFQARAHLVYGEWLRRENRRVDARGQLASASEMLSGMGAFAFAERARRELAATGASARRRTVDTVTDLTDQETQVAALAVRGYTNPDIASQLFISPRTVEWHLRKVYSKLGISSRKEIGRALGDVDRHPVASS